MAKKKAAKQSALKGEQMDLIDIGPENAKAMKPIARRYNAAKKERIAASAQEVKLKGKL